MSPKKLVKYQGKVKWFKNELGYGFIARNDTKEDVFVHFTAIISEGYKNLEKDALVEFEIEETPRGPQAINVYKLVSQPLDNKGTKHNKDVIKRAVEAIRNLVSVFNIASKRKFTFLLLGRTGVGKSSTINTLLGERVAETGDFEATTFEVKYYKSRIKDVNYTIVDTPGLCDDREDKGNDLKYIKKIKTTVKQIDSIWFATPLSEKRVRSDEKYGIKIISEQFGKDIWNHAIIVFTFSDYITKDEYPITIKTRTELIRKEIAKYAGNEIANRIPSVAASNKKQTNPDGQLWLGELYTKVFKRMSANGALPFFLLTAPRVEKRTTEEIKKKASNPKESQKEKKLLNEILNLLKKQEPQKKNEEDEIEVVFGELVDEKPNEKRKNNIQPSTQSNTAIQIYNPAPIILSENQRQEVKEHFNTEIKKEIDAKIILDLAVVGSVVGSFAGPVGSVVGGLVGAAIGTFAWFTKK